MIVYDNPVINSIIGYLFQFSRMWYGSCTWDEEIVD